jgi:hypothetical protein
MSDPFDRVAATFADAGERLDAYADVWRSAIARNAADDYEAKDFLVDLQTLWGMGLRDVTLAAATAFELAANLLPDRPQPPEGARAGAEQEARPDPRQPERDPKSDRG